jgi:predicted RNA-binding protein with PUA-like domain
MHERRLVDSEGPVVARWLFKEEPEEYSFADLQRDGETTWEGVANALALKHLRAVRPGDEVFYYHTGKEKAVVGVMRVAAVVEKDGSPVVTVKPTRRLANAVPLAVIKADPLFADWELVRISRLSVMPVPDALWKRIEELAKTKAAG